MSTITKHRTWCKRCLEFTLHIWIKIDSCNALICEDCKNEDTGYSFKEVPTEKLLEQRERYKKQKFNKLEKLLNVYTNPIQDVLHMMSAPGDIQNIKIIECDAGQKQIDEKSKEKYEEAKRIFNEMKQDYNDNYKHLNNNDKCPCGSNLKYKKCHLIHWRKYEISKN